MATWKLSARAILALMVFWGQIQNYMMRVNLSILIVEMVKDPQKQSSTNVTTNLSQQTCMVNRQSVESQLVQEDTIKDDQDPLLEWDELMRGHVLGAVSIGYLTTQIIGGRLTEYYGVKRVYGLGLFLTTILTFLSPVVAKLNVYAFMLLRIFIGVFEGVTFPALQAMTTRWIPVKERNSFIARSYFGSVFGLVITFPLCGFLSDTLGWESAFYVIGCISTIWFIFWWFLVFDTPESHPRIEASELTYIKNELGATIDAKPKAVPWKSILTSVPVWALIITDCGNCWGLVTLGSNGPAYMKYMLGVDIKLNGILSGLPMLSRYLGGFTWALLADWLIAQGHLSIVWVRRIFNSICMVGPAIVMFMIGFSPNGTECSIAYVETLLCLGMFFNGALSSGHFATPGDLAPNYAGTVFGISNTISGGGIGYVVPVFIGYFTNKNMTFEAWTIVFATASTIYLVTNLFYFFLISGEVQSWNYHLQDMELEEKESFMKNPVPKAEPEETTNI